MIKFGWDLPPGCTVSMLPGNSREEMEAEAMMDEIYAIFGYIEGADTNGKGADLAAQAIYKLVGDAYAKGVKDGHADEQMAMSPLHDEVISVIYMFKEIERNREMPAFADTWQQYVTAGKQLEATFYSCTGLEKIESESR